MMPADAIRAARAVIDEAFEDEIVLEVRLEELRFDKRAGCWIVTFAFTRRPQDRPAGAVTRRSRRTISLRDADGELQSIRRRAPLEASAAAG